MTRAVLVSFLLIACACVCVRAQLSLHFSSAELNVTFVDADAVQDFANSSSATGLRYTFESSISVAVEAADAVTAALVLAVSEPSPLSSGTSVAWNSAPGSTSVTVSAGGSELGEISLSCEEFGVAQVSATLTVDGDFGNPVFFAFNALCPCHDSQCGAGHCENGACVCDANWFGPQCLTRLQVTPAACSGEQITIEYERDSSVSSYIDMLAINYPLLLAYGPSHGYSTPVTLADMNALAADEFTPFYSYGFMSNAYRRLPLAGTTPLLADSVNYTIAQPNPLPFPLDYTATIFTLTTFRHLALQLVYQLPDSDASCVALAGGHCSTRPGGGCDPTGGTCDATSGACVCAPGRWGGSCERGCTGTQLLKAYGGSFRHGSEANEVYLNGITCAWQIRPNVTLDYVSITGITVSFVSIGIEVNADSVKVYAGTAADGAALMLDGVAAGDSVTVPGTEALVVFTSNQLNPSPRIYPSNQGVRGFEATYYTNGCPAGFRIKSLAEGNFTCIPCPAGSVTVTADQFSCTPCEAGKAQPSPAQSLCTPCAFGFATNGSTGAATCTACGPGFFAEAVGTPACEPCPPGEYSASNASHACSPCPTTAYNPEYGSSSCIECPRNSKPIFQGAASLLDCECEEGFFSSGNATGVACESCPFGGVCVGGVAEPVSRRGFWAHPSSPLTFMECTPARACPGGVAGSCALGYSGEVCSTCSSGYYKNDNKCKPCDSETSSEGDFVLLLVLLLVFAALLYTFTEEKILRSNVTALGLNTTAAIIITFAQILGNFRRHTDEWPGFLGSVLSALNFFNLHIDYLHLECVWDTRYVDKFYLRVFSPLILVGFLVVVWVLMLLQGLVSRALTGSLSERWPMLAAMAACYCAEHSEVAKQHNVQDDVLQSYRCRRASIQPSSMMDMVRYEEQAATAKVQPSADTGPTPMTADNAATKPSRRRSSVMAALSQLELSQYLRIHAFLLFTQPIVIDYVRFALGVVLFVDLFYIYLITSALEIFDCYEQPDGSYTLKLDASLRCFEGDEWFDLLPASLFALIVYGIGLPLMYLYILGVYKAERSLRRYRDVDDDDDVDMYATHPWLGYFKHLWLTYKARVYKGELRNVLRKFLLSAAIVSLANDSSSKIVISLVALLVSFYWYSVRQPYRLRTHNVFDMRLSLCLIVLLLAALVFINPTVDDSFDDVVGVCAVASIVGTFTVIAVELYHSVRLIISIHTRRTQITPEQFVVARKPMLSAAQSLRVLRHLSKAGADTSAFLSATDAEEEARRENEEDYVESDDQD